MMNRETDNQLERYCQALLMEAEEKKNEFMAKLDQTKVTEVEKAETEVLEETYHYIQNSIEKIRSDSAKKLSSLEYDTKMELLKQREALVADIFARVEEQLLLYRLSKNYPSFLAEVCKRTAPLFNEPCLLQMNPQDLVYADELIRLFSTGSKAEATDKIRFGGVIIRSKGRVVDQTLDRRLSDEKKDFIEKSGLTVQ